MKPAFYLAAAAMIACALTLLLRPLLPAGRRPRGGFALALGIAAVLPLKDCTGASATWKHLRRSLGAGSALAQPVARQIAIADAAAKPPAAP